MKRINIYFTLLVFSLASILCFTLVLRPTSLHVSVSIQVNRVVPTEKVSIAETSLGNSKSTGDSESTTHEVILPFPNYTIPLEQILQQPWIPKLKLLLKNNVAGKQVVPMVINWKFIEPFLNWLISAKVVIDTPLQNIIVFATDQQMHNFLLRKKIAVSFLVNCSSIVLPNLNITIREQFWVVRATLFRLLNYWGYDVLNFDSDVVILKNPQPIFDAHLDSDIVASVGGYPMELNRLWGITLCMGVVLLRSTPRIGSLWKHFSEANSTDDQIRLNFALHNSNLHWLSNTSTIASEFVEAKCDDGLKITAIPRNMVCRGSAPKPGVYVWHMWEKYVWKKLIALNGKHWYLSKDWEKPNSLTGIKWLASVTL